jgi:hypothetical protein
MKMRREHAIITLVLATAWLVTGCLAGPPSRVAEGAPATFFAGVWHGLIAPFTLIASLLNPAAVRMYEAHNVGPQYDLGFLMGFIMLLAAPAVIRLVRRRSG